ncbi:MAG TPA: amidohydrolase family protein [Tepidimicrobium sp.]|nr:amidohydrolase family protein [Tepidimicrobium sp.]
MIIDYHVHITPPELIDNWRKIAQKEDYFKLLSESPVNKFATAEDIVKELDRSGVDKAVVFGFGFKDMGLCRYVNDYVMRSIKKYPDKLIGYMVVSPNSKDMEKEMDRCLDGGLRGIGELFPHGQDFDISNPKEVGDLANLSMERNLPVIIHTNEPVGHYYAGKTDTTPVEACEFAANFQELNIIFAHWGGGLLFYEMMPEIKKQNKNVYYDTAATPYLYHKNIYKVAREIGVLDRILFATDYPLIPMNQYIEDVETSGLNREEQSKVLGENAKKLLGKKAMLAGSEG